MRKIAVFARGLMMSVCVLLTMTACSEEELVAPEENGGADNTTTITTPTDVPMKTIRISAGMAQGEATRTTLAENREVLWQAGDQYTIIEKDYIEDSQTLRIRLNEPGSGLGIKLGQGTVYFKYEDLNVVIAGEDVTQKIMSTSTADNAYKVGATNSDEKYQYTTLNSVMRAKVYGSSSNRTIYIARCTSSDENQKLSKDKEAVITLKGIRWGTTNNPQTLLTEKTTNLVNGSQVSGKTLKDVAEYYWVPGLKSDLTLTSDAGNPYGIFEGQIPADAKIDENTMAVYPAGVCTGYSNGKLTISIPQEQKYVENSFARNANIMVGELEIAEDGNYDATFSNMMGVFTLSLTGDNDFVSEITLTDKGNKKLWGTATIDANAYTSGISTDDITGGGNSIKMTFENLVELTSEAKKFYFVVPAGAFASGLDVNVTTVDNRTMTKSTTKSNVIERNDIKNMPAFAAEFAIPEFKIENSVLQEYLAKGPYSKWGADSYFQTRIVIYYLSTLGNNAVGKDYPMSKDITWTGNATEYKVTLTDLTKNKPIFTDRSVTSNSYKFINMVPDHKYLYTVKDNNNIVITSGKFIAKGQVRMIKVDDTWNFRDMGGWTGLNGNKVQYEWLYRCGSLNGKWTKGTSKTSPSNIGNPANYNTFSTESRQQLIDIGVKGELDLRAIPGEDNNSSNDYSHSYSIDTPHTGIDGWLFERYMFNNVQSKPLDQSKSDIVIDCMAWIIKQVVYNNNPVAFHCKSGADRTGMLAYLIHSLLGVEEGYLALDYEITNFSHEQEVVTGKAEIRGKYTRQNTDGMYKEAFTTFDDSKGKNRQEKAYYYLNQYFNNKKIKASDLNKFIEKMLGMEAGSYTAPQWATEEGVTIEKDN